MRKSAWFHLALLIALGVVFLLGSALLRGQPLADALRYLPSSMYVILPALAGIAVGTLHTGSRSVSTAVRVVVAVTLLMLLLDLASTDTTDSVSRSVVALGRGGWAGTGEVLRAYPFGHPRIVAENALERGALLLLPAVLVGLVSGISAWVRERVTFRTEGDATAARWVVAWVLVPAAFALVLSWSSGYAYRILFRGASLWLPLVPYLPALALATVGWRAAAAGTTAGDHAADAGRAGDAPLRGSASGDGA